MARSRHSLATVFLLALASGCSYCCSPYDYCGPVVDGGYNPCGIGAPRYNSAFTGVEVLPYGEELLIEGDPQYGVPTEAEPLPTQPQPEILEPLPGTSMRSSPSRSTPSYATGSSRVISRGPVQQR